MRKSFGRSLIVAALCVAVTSLSPSAVSADTETFNDPDDTKGQLDFKWIRQTHASDDETGQRMLAYTIKTYDEWRITRWGLASIDLNISTDGDAASERQVYITRMHGNLVAEVRGLNGYVYGYAKVTHPTARTLYVQFPRELLGDDVSTYRWYATSTFSRNGYAGCDSTANPVVPCVDRLPNAGTRQHNL